jgi:hypothetical protein
MYIMNKDDIITVSEFRKNTKVILDATRNKPLILRRGDELFEISWKGSIWQVPLKTNVVSQEKKIGLAEPNNEDVTSLEEACCMGSTPCKHWHWDSSSGEGYVNILSGRVREV